MSKRAVLAILGVLAITMPVGLIALSAAHAYAPEEICTTGRTELCYNTKGGLNDVGNPVIGWSPDANNNYYAERFLYNLCSGGRVTASHACPFTNGSGLNTRYNGDQIVALEENNADALCVGTNDNGRAELTTCPDTFGNGGGPGTYVVESPAKGEGAPYYFVNVFWSDLNYQQTGSKTSPVWECAFTNGNSISMDFTTGEPGPCTWNFHLD